MMNLEIKIDRDRKYSSFHKTIAFYCQAMGRRRLCLRIQWQSIEVWVQSPRRPRGKLPQDDDPILLKVLGIDRHLRWAGTVLQDGRIKTAASGSPLASSIALEEWDAIHMLLGALEAEPESLSRYLVRSGRCCFCRRPLTEPRSTHAGYGPDCAGRTQLPW